MILWLLLSMLVVTFAALCWQTFRLEEREMFIDHLQRQMKQMERNDIIAREFNDFVEFHKHIKKTSFGMGWMERGLDG